MKLFLIRLSCTLRLDVPSVIFAKNGLSIHHSSGFGIKFDPIEALKNVNSKEDLVHVSMSKEWLEARADHADINKIAKRYDWTFTPTNYRGSLIEENDTPGLIVESTQQKIDYERLKIQEKILFYDEIILYEDELDDNGVSKLSLKIVSNYFLLINLYDVNDSRQIYFCC